MPEGLRLAAIPRARLRNASIGTAPPTAGADADARARLAASAIATRPAPLLAAPIPTASPRLRALSPALR